jgi:hypothetical protein
MEAKVLTLLSISSQLLLHLIVLIINVQEVSLQDADDLIKEGGDVGVVGGH